VTADGSLWAATTGGLLCWRAGSWYDRPPRRWTTAEGLISNDVRQIAQGDSTDDVYVTLPTAVEYVATSATSAVLVPSPDSSGSTPEIRGVVHSRNSLLVATNRGLFGRETAAKAWQAQPIGSGKPEEIGRATAFDPGNDAGAAIVTASRLIPYPSGEALPLPNSGGQFGAFTAVCPDGDGSLLLASSLGMWRTRSGCKAFWQPILLPRGSRASHVSALCRTPSGILAALYGDGVYMLHIGKSTAPAQWTRVGAAEPAVRRVTTLWSAGDIVLAGTAGDGVWAQDGDGPWRRLPLTAALPSADIAALTSFRGRLWTATFDAGITAVDPTTGDTTTYSRRSGLAADVPREFAIFHDRLYVRYADGAVDRWDGATWTLAFPGKTLPRPQVYAIAATADRLYVGGWAGWATMDAAGQWEHHWHDPELTGQVITAIAAESRQDGSPVVWIGTQRRGLLRYSQGRYTAFDETRGLSDDWITCIRPTSNRLLIGTYTGGLLEREGERFRQRFRPDGFAIRSITECADGVALAATPVGVYRERSRATGTTWELIPPAQTGGLEAQALLATANGIWVGSRSGLAYAALAP